VRASRERPEERIQELGTTDIRTTGEMESPLVGAPNIGTMTSGRYKYKTKSEDWRRGTNSWKEDEEERRNKDSEVKALQRAELHSVF